jgi:hypothetical protein
VYRSAFSVPDAVREVLAGNQLYLQALQAGIVNYTAMAEKMKPEIEKLIGSAVNLNTIVVAVKRLADTMEQEPPAPKQSGPKAKMSLTGSIIDIDFQKEADKEILENIIEEFFEQDSQYNLFQTDNHFTLLAEDADEVKSMMADAIEKFDAKINEGLAKITISLSKDEKNPYQLLSLISNIFYNSQIPVHSVFFNPSEMVLTLNDRDAARVYDLIRAKIG